MGASRATTSRLESEDSRVTNPTQSNLKCKRAQPRTRAKEREGMELQAKLSQDLTHKSHSTDLKDQAQGVSVVGLSGSSRLGFAKKVEEPREAREAAQRGKLSIYISGAQKTSRWGSAKCPTGWTGADRLDRWSPKARS
jgi:hypothetical protein